MKLKNPEVRIEPTNLCNANCTICPRDKMTRKKTTMPMEHFCDLVDQAKALGAKTISVFGYGEPLMDRLITERVRYCTERGLRTFITTNASLLNRVKSEDLIEAGLSHIRFSAHGIEGAYERVHRNLSWDVTIKNIIEFDAIKPESLISEAIVIPMESEEIEQIQDFWLGVVDELEIWKPHNWTDGRDYRKVHVKKKTCGRPFRGPLQITADGKMIVCCFDYNGVLEVGDTYQDTLQDILTGEKFNRIREQHKGDLSGLICENCDQLNETYTGNLIYSSIEGASTEMTSSEKFSLEDSCLS